MTAPKRAKGAAAASEPAAAFDPEAILSLRGLTLVANGVPRPIVNGFELDLKPGETVGIVGESGSGKTMTILSLIGLLPNGLHVESGAMRLGGETFDLRDEKRLRQLRGNMLGMIFQEPMSALDPCFTVEHHIAEVLTRFETLSRSQAHDSVIELLRRVQIPNPEDVARRYPHQISGGMAQRVSIARALAPKPKVLLADEPTTALDVTVQSEILELLRGLSGSQGLAIVLVTHDWGVVADICDRAAVLYRGDLLECAGVVDLFNQPQHPYTQALLKSNPHSVSVGEPLPTIQDTMARMREAEA